ncbi:Ankyrin-repeat and fibronectin type III domain-containing 1 [Branchiostoma belcheri]|nr:Ankyrin-repeat and fibronectin type III domain-containing 1 [Branchiostoma belcheri]
MTSAEIRGTLYGKVRRYLATTKKQVRFNVNLLVDHEEDLIKELQLWMIQQCDPNDFRPAESEVWLERYDGQHQHPPEQMGDGEFWDFVYSDRWDDYSSLRICEGALLQRLMEVFYGLKRQGKLHEFETEIVEVKTKAGCYNTKAHNDTSIHLFHSPSTPRCRSALWKRCMEVSLWAFGHTKHDMRLAFIYYGLSSQTPKDEQPTTISPKTSPHLAMFRSDPVLVERSVENLVSFLSKRSMSWPSDLATAATTASSNLQNQSRSLTLVTGDSTCFNMDSTVHTRLRKSPLGSSTCEFSNESGRQTADSFASTQLGDSANFSYASSPTPDVFSFGSSTTTNVTKSTSEKELAFCSRGSKGKFVCFDVEALAKPESGTDFVPPRPVSPHPSKSGSKSGQSEKEPCYPRLPPTFGTPRKDMPSSLTALQSSDKDKVVEKSPPKAKVLDIVTRLKEAQRLKKTRRQAVSAEGSESSVQTATPDDDLDAPRSILRQHDNTNYFPENSNSQVSDSTGDKTPPFYALNRTYSFDKLIERRKLGTTEEEEESVLDEDERKLPDLNVLLGHYALSRRRHLSTDTKTATSARQDFFPRVKEEDFVEGCLKALEGFVVRKEQAVVHVGRTVIRVITTITINKVPLLLKRS